MAMDRRRQDVLFHSIFHLFKLSDFKCDFLLSIVLLGFFNFSNTFRIPHIRLTAFLDQNAVLKCTVVKNIPTKKLVSYLEQF